MKATTVPLQRLASFPRVRIQLRHATALLCLTLFISICGSASAASDGRLLATGGATQIEGSAGGGLVPWAVLTGYATRDEIGVTAFATHVEVEDFGLDSLGVAINLRNRVELSPECKNSFSVKTKISPFSTTKVFLGNPELLAVAAWACNIE